MNLPDAEIIRNLRAGTIDEERLARYLLENFTATPRLPRLHTLRC